MTRNRWMHKFHRTPTGLWAVALLFVAAAATVSAQTTYQPKLVARPLTPAEITNYKLPSTTEVSSGLLTVSVGEPLYLEVLVDIGIPANSLLGSVNWQLTSQPSNSKAALSTSPLGPAVPVFEPSDRLVAQVAGRMVLRPDVTGPYVVTATVSLGSAGVATVAQTFIAGKYVGISACTVCHSGGLATVMVPTWQTTEHATMFTRGLNGQISSHYGSSCESCHTVGYDANATVSNGGFADVAKQLGWTFPTTLGPGVFNSLPAPLQNLSNIQCENCHGPGSEHASHGGDTLEIAVATNTGACSQCHDSPPNEPLSQEWEASVHAVTTTDPAGNASCVGCHTGTGFIDRMNGVTSTNLAYNVINCYTCHESHGKTTPTTAVHLLRNMGPVTLADGTKVTTGGAGSLCMNCHQARQNAMKYAPTTAGSSHFGPHEGPQADMIAGANGYTYGQKIPTSAHQFAVTDTCVGCHMQTLASTDPGFLQAGDHTWKMSYTAAGAKAETQLVAACQGCHGPDVTTFDFPLLDYNGDGVIQGVQTEVQSLLDQLSAMLPGGGGKPQTSLNIDSTWTQPQLEAAYNWQFVANDGSRGIHNTAYAVGLLKASIADLKSRQ